MPRRIFHVREFERRFDSMKVDELKEWGAHFTYGLQFLAPKIQKIAKKRIYKIEKAIAQKSNE